MQYLILGAGGYVGKYLYQRMIAEGLDVIGTVHRPQEDEKLIPFDILKDSVSDITKRMTDEEKLAVICIAQTDLNRCKTEYELSRLINVKAVQKVIGELVQGKFQVIFFSSDNVFDGTKGNYTEQDETNAISLYGKMKEEMEEFLLKNYPEVCIFRIPRVSGAEREKRNLLTDLESKLPLKEIRCIRDNRISIIAQEDIFQACLLAAKQRMRGLYNVANGEALSRKDLAEVFFQAIGAQDKHIVELDLEEFGFEDTRPLKTSLNNAKFKKETGYNFTSYETLVELYLKKNGYK